MSRDEARWIIAHELGIDLGKFGVGREDVERVQRLRSSMQRGRPVALAAPVATGPTPSRSTRSVSVGPTPASVFNSRGLHMNVEKSSRGLFVGGHATDAVRRAFQGVNNRVRKLASTTRDGHDLMAYAFKPESPVMRMTDMSSQSEIDEQRGLMYLMMGAMAAIRNPSTHDDAWALDGEQEAVLDALAFASLLHRYLDRCEEFGV